MWFLLALIAAIFFGTGQVIVRKGQINLPPIGDNILAALIVVTIIAPLMIIRGLQVDLLLETLPFAILVAFLYITYYYVISKGQLSITATLLAAFPVVTVILSYFILGERPSFPQYLAIFMVLFGVIVLAKSTSGIEISGRKKILSSIFWGGFGAFTQGLADFTTKIGVLQSSANNFTFLMALSYVPAVLIVSVFDRQGRTIFANRFPGLLISIIGVALIELGLVPYNMAFEAGPASLVSTVGASQILVMVILAKVLLHDRLRLLQYLGIFLTVLGIVTLGFFQ